MAGYAKQSEDQSGIGLVMAIRGRDRRREPSSTIRGRDRRREPSSKKKKNDEHFEEKGG
jgi:hypothetical protein